ncbi:hypothetical protein Hamer_G031174, partial [Homarus americanus]
VELYQHRSYGKVYSSKSVARYPSSVGHDLVAVTDKENYVLTEEEKEIIIHLKEWWAKHCSEFTPQGEDNLYAKLNAADIEERIHIMMILKLQPLSTDQEIIQKENCSEESVTTKLKKRYLGLLQKRASIEPVIKFVEQNHSFSLQTPSTNMAEVNLVTKKYKVVNKVIYEKSSVKQQQMQKLQVFHPKQQVKTI